MTTNYPTQNPTPATPNTQPTNIPPTAQSSLQPTPKKKTPWVLISLIVLLFSSTGLLGYKYYQIKQQLDNQLQTLSPSSQLVVGSPSPVGSTLPKQEIIITGKTCHSVNLGISVTMPNNTWNCYVDNLDKEQSGWDGTITAQSSLFDVTISSLGRGPYCEPRNSDPSSPRYDPDYPDKTCEVLPFYSNDTISLNLYKLNKENKEIFGSMTDRGWVSIKYKNMEKKDLTVAEKSELILLIDSLTH